MKWDNRRDNRLMTLGQQKVEWWDNKDLCQVTSSPAETNILMAKIRLMKPSNVRYVDCSGAYVPKGTKGAKKVKETTPKWYAEWRENGKKRRKPLATDKGVAQKMLGDLILEMELSEAGMLDPHKHQLNRPITEHVADYLSSLKQQEVSDKHFSERSRCLLAVIHACKAETLNGDCGKGRCLPGVPGRSGQDEGYLPRCRSGF